MKLQATTASVLGLIATSILAFGCAGSGEVEENLDHSRGESAPIIGGTPATEYAEAALVDMFQNGQETAACSGTLVAPSVVLTAGHCVFNFDGWHITLPFAGNQTATASSGTTYDWKVQGESVDPSVHDLGLIFLDTPLKIAAYPEIATSPIGNGDQIVNIGRIDNGKFSTTGLYISAPIQVTSGQQSGFPFDYSAVDKIQPGDSGGPDMVAGTHTLVAVNSGAGGSSEVLARADLLASWIQQNIASHGGAGTGAGTGNGNGSGNGNGMGNGNGNGSGNGNAAKESEPNNVYTKANPLDGSIDGDLVGGDRDWFTWSINDASPYDLELDATGDARIHMWKLVSGQYYLVPDSTSTSSTHTASGPGQYYVLVGSPTGASQSYTLTLTK